MNATVFITHSSLDYKKARAVVDALERQAIKCWISERDIGAGDNYGDSIVDAIEGATAMVLVFSANANNSEEIKKEIALASQRKITVIPVRLEEVMPSKAFRYELVTRNWIDLFADWDEGIQRLVDRISSITGVAPVILPPPAVRLPRVAPMWIAAGAAAVLLAGGGAYFLAGKSHTDVQTVTAKGLPSSASVAASTQQAPGTAVRLDAKPYTGGGTAPPKPALWAAAQDASMAMKPGAHTADDPGGSPGLVTAPQAHNAGPTVPTQTAALVPPVSMKAAAAPEITGPQIGPPPAFDAGTRGGQVFKECEHCPEMVVVPRGTAVLGSPIGEPGRQSNEQTPHDVTIPKPFAVGRYAVTFDEWDACVAGGGCNHYTPDDDSFGRANRPVIFVSWNDAQAYVDWLKKKTGQAYRLLSEAEWEYAARGCATTACPNAPFWFGTIRPEVANYDSRFAYEGSPKAERERQTMPVDQANPNPFGLFSMLGNVQQWVEDCWNAKPDSTQSDAAPVLTGDCTDRVIRGGSWSDKPEDLRAAARSWDDATDRESPNIGIRVARDLSP